MFGLTTTIVISFAETSFRVFHLSRLGERADTIRKNSGRLSEDTTKLFDERLEESIF